MSPLKHTAPHHHRRSLWWLFWLCAAVSQQARAQDPPPPAEPQVTEEAPATPSPSEDIAKPVVNQPVAERLAERHRQLLHDLKGPPTALWLPVDDRQVLAFWQPDRSGKPLGAVLMLHDRGENPRRAATLRRLHEYLPTHGWATFSVELPDLPGAAVPPRPNPPAPAATPNQPAAENSPSTEAPPSTGNPAENASVDEKEVVHQETEPEASVEATDNSSPTPAPTPSREEVVEHIHRRITAATAYLHQQGQYNLVLLGEGSSAHWVLQHLDKAVPPPPVESADKKSKGIIDRAFRAVILVNPRTPEAAELVPLDEVLRHPEIPTFDVFTDFHLDTLAAAQNRRQAAKQQGYEHYVVRRLPPANGANPESVETALTKAVRGFLQKYAQGVELK